MKKALPYITIIALLASCSQDREALHTPRAKPAGSFRTDGRNPHNQQARRNKSNDGVGFGIDLNRRDPNKFSTVKKPRKK